ncbi:MAG: copper homeostasis protein CutC, partial [Candidatus Latescibacteria bacterium]|nr:copper homeostasis protein CutC [Candidatus Latescibacterota bacterium]
IRTRPGDFSFAAAEVRAMEGQIRRAAEAGVDGVVIGALGADGALDRAALAGLVAAAKGRDLETTLHRAFDATPDPVAALETLVELGVDRVLSSGTPWKSDGGAPEGLESLRETVEQAAGRIEVVVGGGVEPQNADVFATALPGDRWSLHAYSGVRMDGRVRAERVRALVECGGGW